MDRTTLYREIVRLAQGPHEQIQPKPHPSDPIVTQASQAAASLHHLHRHLNDLRQAYLSTTAPQKLSEREKEEIDYSLQSILQQENKKIKTLERTSRQQQHQSKPKNWFLSDPNREGERETMYLNHQGIFIALNTLLKQCSEQFQEMQGIRLSRKVQKRHVSAHLYEKLPRETPGIVPDAPQGPEGPQAPQAPEPTFTQEQQQVLVEENDAVLRDLHATLNKTHQIEKSMTEVAQLQSELSTHLTAQTEQIHRMMDEAYKTGGDVDGANLQLKKAQERNKRASKIIIYTSIGVGSLLLLYDWVL